MRHIILGLVMALCLLPPSAADGARRDSDGKPFVSGSVVGGYYGGVGLHLSGTLGNFAQGFPLSVRFSFGRASAEPGDPLLARKVFINNNTNGTPEESGHVTTFRLDFSRPVNLSSHYRSAFFVGARHSRFVGEFVYVGGNEDFEVRCNQWGVGTGLDNFFAIGHSLDLVVTTGVDYYFAAKLYGHDSSYFPDGTSINSRDDYQYEDADDAVNQPKIRLMLMIGLSYSF
jgi:hypothetical protein